MTGKEENFIQTYIRGIVPSLKNEIAALEKDFGNCDCYLANIKCVVDSALALLEMNTDEPFGELISRVTSEKSKEGDEK